jgi:hypothetical protein
MSPEVTFGDYLLCLNFYQKLDEKKFRRLLEKVKPFAARNASDLASLIDWMNQNGLAGDVVKWVDKLPPAQLSSPPASVAVADAYATVKNWSRLKRWTRTGNWGDAEYLRLAYGAIAERHLRSATTRARNLSSKRFGSLPLNCQRTCRTMNLCSPDSPQNAIGEPGRRTLDSRRRKSNDAP